MKEAAFDYNSYYNTVSSVYNDIRLDSKDDFATTVDTILGACPRKNGFLLDIGCGTGKYGEALVKRGFVVSGIDKSLSQVHEAKKIINAQLGDVCNLPFEEQSFDVCIMIIMIHHLSNVDRIQAFKEIYRVLKPGGVLIIKTASHEDLKYRISSRFFPEALLIDQKRYPSIEVLQSELTNFESVITKSIVLTSQFVPSDMARKLEKRRTSNLGMLSDIELKNGLQRFKAYYKNMSIATKESHYTFVIAYKGNI